MSDPLSVTASVIAVTGLALTSCKALNDSIKGFQNAPKSVSEIRHDLDLVQDLLRSLQSVIRQDANVALSPQQVESYRHLGASLKQCEESCNSFRKKLTRLTSHSTPGRVNWLDRSRLVLSENEVLVFKAMLERDKQTLDVALGLVTLSSIRQNRDALQSLETKIAGSVSEFTGQLEGLQLAMRTFSDNYTETSTEKQTLVMAQLNQQEQMLKQNLKVCELGLTELTEYIGTNVKHAVALDKARLFVGNLGIDNSAATNTPSVNVGFLGAKDSARIAAGNMSVEAAKTFWSD